MENNHNNQNKQNMDSKRKRNKDEKANHVSLHCKKRHTRECLKSSNKYFACGEAGHIKKNSPKLKKDNAPVLAKLKVANVGDASRDNLVQRMIIVSEI